MTRVSLIAAGLGILLLLYAIPACMADGSPVTGHYYDGDDPPPGSIVGREEYPLNQLGIINRDGTVDDISFLDGPRTNTPYSDWKATRNGTGKGAWVPNLPLSQRQQVSDAFRDIIQSAQFQVYPNNRGPSSINDPGAVVKAFERCNLTLPYADRPEITPTEVFDVLTQVRMGNLQHLDVQDRGFGFAKLTVQIRMPSGELKTFTSSAVPKMAIPSGIRDTIQKYINQGPGSSGSGGVESRPLWLGRSRAQETMRATIVTASPLLGQLLPLTGPNGETRVETEPSDVMGGSNAVAATGMDYLSSPGVVAVSIFGAETADSVYEHDYPVCSRVRLSEIDGINPVQYNGHWWWTIRAHNDSQSLNELTIPVSIILNGSSATVDSRYLVEDYPPGITGTVLNYQIRARELCDALCYLDSILEELAETCTVAYANVVEPAYPLIFAHTAVYRDGRIQLDMENLGESATVRFSGPVWPEPTRDSETTVESNIDVPAGRSIVNLPVGYIHDAVIYIQSGGFTDKVYIAGGYWFAWDDKASGGASNVSMVTGPLEHSPLPGAATCSVSPPLAEMTGLVSDVLSWGHVGIGYSFRQAATPIDISAADSVAFWMKGDGKQYRVKLESASVYDNDFHGFTFTAPTEWQVIRIPFTEFAQEGWGAPVAWTGTDIRTISFVTVGRPHESVHLFVDRISFLQAGDRADIIAPMKRAANGSDSAAFGATVTAVFGDSFYVESADRSSGIRVQKVGHGLQEGDKIDFGGIAQSDPDGERYVEASCVKKVGTGTVKPVGMNIRALGGTDYQYAPEGSTGQQGVTETPYGLNNIGLLVRVWGTCTRIGSSDFLMSDGSGMELRCTVPEGGSIAPGSRGLAVTGISSYYSDGGQLRRMLRVRKQGDIIPLW